jgi:hypothetical protein
MGARHPAPPFFLRAARPGRLAAARRWGSAAAGKTPDPVDVVPQVLVADVGDPDGNRVRVVGQFCWLVVGGEPLQVALGQHGDDGQESLVRATQIGQHLGEGLLFGRLDDQLVEGIVRGRANSGKIDADRGRRRPPLEERE